MSRSDTYGVSAVGVLELCLVQLRLLLRQSYFDLGMFCSDNFEEVFCEHLRTCNHGLVWTSIKSDVSTPDLIWQDMEDTYVTWMYIGSSCSCPVS